MGLGMLGSALAGAGEAIGKGVAQIGLMEINKQIDLERTEAIERIRERTAISAENRKQAAVTAERERIRGDAQKIADQRGTELASQARSRVGDVADPVGQGLLSQAISDAEQSGAYKQTITPRDMAMASDDYRSVANIDQQSEANARHASERGEDMAFRKEELKLRERQLGQSSKLHAIQLEEATLKLDLLKKESKIPPAVRAQADILRDEIKTINKTIYDKEAQNTLDPKGQEALAKRVSDLSKQVSDLYAPYMPEGSKPKQEAPAGTGWDSSSGSVVLNGKAIGTAKTQAEAATLIKAAKEKPADAPLGPKAEVQVTNTPARVEDIPWSSRTRYRDLKQLIDSGSADGKAIKEFNRMSDEYWRSFERGAPR